MYFIYTEREIYKVRFTPRQQKTPLVAGAICNYSTTQKFQNGKIKKKEMKNKHKNKSLDSNTELDNMKKKCRINV